MNLVSIDAATVVLAGTGTPLPGFGSFVKNDNVTRGFVGQTTAAAPGPLAQGFLTEVTQQIPADVPVDFVFTLTVPAGISLQDLAAGLSANANFGTDSADADGNLDIPGHKVVVPISSVSTVAGTSVPTLTEWGSIIMGLLLLAAGTVFIFRTGIVIAGSGAQAALGVNMPLVVPAVFARTLAVFVTVTLVVLATTSLLWRRVGWVDTGGALMSTLVCAYIVHLWVLAYYRKHRGS